MSKIKTSNDESLIIMLIVGLFLIIVAVIWGNYDKKSQVLSPKLKSLLADDENANNLLDAIEKEKSGIEKIPEFEMNGKTFTIERSSRQFVKES